MDTKAARDVAETKVKEFESRLRGQLIRPADADYESARKVFNGMIDKHPGLIARARDVADVINSVNFARDNGVSVAIRGGGHNAGGLGIVDDGLVIDLSPMKSVRVDPAARTVRVDGGATWGDVDHATHVFGLATPTGIISTTGVGGLSLGGGIGHLTRKAGLTVDNMLEADVVLADGRFVTASAERNEDLFWAIRGGGGNFGAVTSFLFRLHPISTVYAGPMLWPLESAGEVLQFYREFITKAPDDISGFFLFMVVPPGPPFPEHLHNKTMAGVMWYYAGPSDRADETFRPIRQFRRPALDLAGPLPHPAVQGMFDALYPPGLQWYWKADFVKEMSDEAIAVHLKYGSQVPSIQSGMHLYPINGAAHRVGKNDTAFSYRDATWASVIVGVDANPANMERIIPWAKDYWSALHPYSAGGAYVNFMMEEGQDRVEASYRDNYRRLVTVKSKYDPDNFFHVNQNIKPSV